MESEDILDKEIEFWKDLRYRSVQRDVMTSLKAGRHPFVYMHLDFQQQKISLFL